jgi:hypothetical protein
MTQCCSTNEMGFHPLGQRFPAVPPDCRISIKVSQNTYCNATELFTV